MVVDDFLAEHWEEFVSKCEAHGEDADKISSELDKIKAQT